MRITLPLRAALALILIPSPALAAPGLGNEVYGATTEPGETEIELGYGTLRGGPDQGEDSLVLEAARGVSSRLRLGARLEFEREAGAPRKPEAAGIEAIVALGSAGGIAFAAYGEVEIGIAGPSAVEAKLIAERRRGPLDLRLNLIAQKPLAPRSPVALGYAAAADIRVVEDFGVGLRAFGDLGAVDRLVPRAEHFVGPAARTEIKLGGREIGIEAGYLFALAKARADARGQARLSLELEF